MSVSIRRHKAFAELVSICGIESSRYYQQLSVSLSHGIVSPAQRTDDKVWSKLVCDGHHYLHERVVIVGIPHPGRGPWDVHGPGGRWGSAHWFAVGRNELAFRAHLLLHKLPYFRKVRKGKMNRPHTDEWIYRGRSGRRKMLSECHSRDGHPCNVSSERESRMKVSKRITSRE